MPDLANWTIVVDSNGVVRAGQALNFAQKKAEAAEKSTDHLAASFRRLAAPIAGVLSLTAGFRKFVEVNREFDRLEAGLVTSTGSAQKAQSALAQLQAVAAKTPNSLRDTVDGFNRLVNYGLDPSEESILSFTNTSSAMGKSLNQLIEAVADAATGEFERLKEFGIKARNQGQTVSFTFRGITTTVKNSSKEIQGYLRRLGETEFAGAAAERMKTLDGALINLGDTWDRVWRTIGNSNIGDVFKDTVKVAQDALEGFVRFTKSDELALAIHSLKSVFTDVAYIIDKSGGAAAFLSQLTPLGGGYASLKEGIGMGPGGGGAAGINAGGRAEETRAKLQADLRKELDLKLQGSKADQERAKLMQAIAGTEKEIARLRAGTQPGQVSSSQDALGVAYANLARFQQKLAALDAGEGGLGQYAKGGGGSRPKTAAELAREKAAREKRIKELREYEKGMALINAVTSGRFPQAQEDYEPSGVGYREYLGLETERERLRRETNARVLSAGNAPEDQRQALIDAIYDEEKQKLEAILNAENEKRDALMDGLRTEEEELQRSYDQRLKTIQDAVKQGIIFEEEGIDIVAKLREKQAEDERQRNLALIQNSAAAGEALFGNLAEAAKNAGGVQSAAYKRLFALSQTFAIASATSSMFTGIAKGLEAGWPAGIPLMIGAAATGAGIISQISALKFAGAYDAGGFIPAGKFGIVGEKRPELIQGPANVVGGAQTAQIMGGRPNIAVYVAPDANQAMSFARSSHNEQAFLVFAQKNKTMLRRLLLS